MREGLPVGPKDGFAVGITFVGAFVRPVTLIVGEPDISIVGKALGLKVGEFVGA